MTQAAVEAGEAYPPVFVVDSQARYLPPVMACPPPRQGRATQTLLYLLVILALGGIAVEAYFIYHLYNVGTTTDTPTAEKNQQDESDAIVSPRHRAEVKPSKPSAHLAGTELPHQDGLMMWHSIGGDSFTHEMDYIDGKLHVKKEGFYFIYSKVYFSESSRTTFTHTVLKSTPRLPKSQLELMRNFQFLDQADRRGGMLNSYLGGVFLLHEGDAIFVTVQNRTRLLRHAAGDNFFGTYML